VTKKITLATVKSFVRKNKDNLFISFRSHFDGMTDGITQSDNKEMRKATFADEMPAHSLGISGAWFVGHSRDYFDPFDENGFCGIEVSNCCGNFILAVQKAEAGK